MILGKKLLTLMQCMYKTDRTISVNLDVKHKQLKIMSFKNQPSAYLILFEYNQYISGL
jgi:hypothetical protein